MRSLAAVLLLGLAGLSVQPGHSQNNADEVTLKVVKYDGLKDAVLKQRGKVVLVDFWGLG